MALYRGGDTTVVGAAESLQDQLASNEAGKGASMIGIYDVGSLITATTVEGALQELITASTSAVAITGGTIDGVTITNSSLSTGNTIDASITQSAGVATFNSTVIFNSSGVGFNGGTSGSTPPFTVDSTYKVTNLNADFVDGYDGSALFVLAEDETVSGSITFTDPLMKLGSSAPGKAWTSSFQVQEWANTSAIFANSNSLQLNSNAYYDTGWKYTTTAGASNLAISPAAMSIRFAGSGTADTALTWTDVFKIDGASSTTVKMFGNTLISDADITPEEKLHIHTNSANNAYMKFTNTVTGTTTSDGLEMGVSASGDSVLISRGAYPINFYTANTFRGKFNGSGKVLLSKQGHDITPNYDLHIHSGNAGADAFIQFTNDGTGTATSDGTLIGVDVNEKFAIINREATDVYFRTSDTFRGKIGGAGNWNFGNEVTTPQHDVVVYENSSGSTYTQYANSTTGNTATDGFIVGIDSAETATIWNYENTGMNFGTNNTKRMEVLSTGGLNVGNATGSVTAAGTVNVSTGFYINSIRPGTGAKATQTSAGTTLTTGTWTTLLFDGEVFDSNSHHSTSTNTDRLVVPAGINFVRLCGVISYAANATGIRQALIQKNGTTTIAWTNCVTVGASGSTRIYVDTGPISVTPGDYFVLQGYQNSGGNLSTTFGGSYDTWFSIEVLA